MTAPIKTRTGMSDGDGKGMTRILIADDEPRILLGLKTLLTAEGYEVETAADGTAARGILEQRFFDIALLDLMMPGMTGHELISHLHAREIDTTVIVVSGDTSIDSAIEALRAGAHDFVRKPYFPEILLKSIENALHRRRLEREGRRMQVRLERSEKLHSFLVNHSPYLIYLLDSQGRFRFVNRQMETLLGGTKGELIGRHFSELLPPDQQDAVAHDFAERQAGARHGGAVELHLLCEGGEGEHIIVENNFIPVELNACGLQGPDIEGGRKRFGMYGVARDITLHKRAEATIHFQAHHDLLTRLPNRTLFKERLTAALAQARHEGGGLAVMFLDIDRFKVVNDHLGQRVGDELLCALAGRINGCLRTDDTLARIGGDEFAILASGIDDMADAEHIAQKIIAALNHPFSLSGHELFAAVSIGIAIYPQHGDSVESLLKNADIAMYHGRNGTHDSHRFYAAHMDQTFSRHLVIEQAIRMALDSGQFKVYYQPQLRAADSRIMGVEALIRWEHPEMGPVSPAEFVPIAEETDLIVALGEWVLRQACTELAAWRAAGHRDVRLAVNCSAIELSRPGFAERVISVLSESGLPGSALEIEITENVLMHDVEVVAEMLHRMSGYGISISIDDFGTGYSSLSYLNQFPIHRLKIDRSFVRRIGDQSRGDSIVSAIIAMARSLEIEIIAEGVETEIQRRFLTDRGCDVLQGFLYSPAIPGGELLALLSERPVRAVEGQLG